MDFITVDKYWSIADQIFQKDEPPRLHGSSPEPYDDAYVLFCNTNLLDRCFRWIKKYDQKVVLITQHSTVSVDDAVYERMPDSVIYWFAKNGNCHGERLSPIPIGLPEPHTRYRDIDGLLCESMKDRAKHNLLYSNFSVDPKKGRRVDIYNFFLCKQWATSKHKGLTQKDYFRALHSHYFAVSPRGKGIDCHRTWECLYLGVIPIVERTVALERLSEGLPILLVDSYEEITEEYLMSILDKYKNMDWDWQKIEFSYWESRIRGKL